MSPRVLFRVAFACSLSILLGACASGGGVAAPAGGDRSVAVAAEPTPATTLTHADSAPPSNVADQASDAVANTPLIVAGAHAPADGNAQTGDAPTQTEVDYAAIYGEAATQPEDDDYAAIYGTGNDAATPGTRNPQDPWEPFNRHVHHFNNGVDRVIAKPLARAYIAVAPRPVRMGVGNFFNNLGQPVSALNALLQGRPKQAGQALARFTVNITLGVLGVFDPASTLGLLNHSEDFGQTLARWGWKRSRYLELPFLGPSTLRDALGGAAAAPLSPLQQIEEDRVRVFLQGLQLVDQRTNLLAADSLREGAVDDYTIVRDAWLQRRDYKVDDNDGADDDSLPPYLQDAPAPDSMQNPPTDTPAPQPAQ